MKISLHGRDAARNPVTDAAPCEIAGLCDALAIEKIEGNPGDTIEFKEVLLRRTDKETVGVGQPYLDTPIKASIVKHIRGPKITVFRFRRRKKSRVKNGHRQPATVIRIEQI